MENIKQKKGGTSIEVPPFLINLIY